MTSNAPAVVRRWAKEKSGFLVVRRNSVLGMTPKRVFGVSGVQIGSCGSGLIA
jgi:hypothetical protein